MIWIAGATVRHRAMLWLEGGCPRTVSQRTAAPTGRGTHLTACTWHRYPIRTYGGIGPGSGLDPRMMPRNGGMWHRARPRPAHGHAPPRRGCLICAPCGL
jgi:hypothetical protein